MPPVTAGAGSAVRVLDGAAYEASIPGLAALLIDAVESGASVNFLRGITQAEAAAWWSERTPLVRDGVITPFVAVDGDRIVGSTLLHRSRNPNAPHRAEVAKVIVLRSYRGRGVGAVLMRTLEDHARAEGRWLLILDTETDSPAASFYASLGWRAAGTIPDFALTPDGVPAAATYYWKDLR